MAEAAEEESVGLELLGRLAAEEPPRYLLASPELSRLARDASARLFSALVPVSPKPLPLDRLLSGEGFDAEQIWHQIDLQSHPLARSLRRSLRPYESMPPEDLAASFGCGNAEEEEEKKEEEEEEEEEDGEEVRGEGGDEEEETEEEEEEEEGKGGVLDDGFFKGEELEEFLEKEEEREYVGNRSGNEEGDAEDDEEDEMVDGEEASDDDAAYAKFEDFYGKKRGTAPRKNGKKSQKSGKKSNMDEDEDGLDMLGMGQESSEELEYSDVDERHKDQHIQNENTKALSTFEKQSKKNQAKIEQIEKELIAPKAWTMMGEVTASKRPKNSALEVDLDFQHNRVRPPIMAEEIAVTIEEIILKRLREGPGHLDEVQRPALVEAKAPKELKELDDKKSQKGLAEIYEEDYVQKAGVGTAPSSALDEQKKEATLLFKTLCVKLDALSHFHFKPKPVIEDMSIQTNVPALAMEEIAPLAVSDAAMLAPEEIFAGKGDIKEDVELTQADRRRRRAKKKRKFKAESAKQRIKKPRVEAAPA